MVIEDLYITCWLQIIDCSVGKLLDNEILIMRFLNSGLIMNTY